MHYIRRTIKSFNVGSPRQNPQEETTPERRTRLAPASGEHNRTARSRATTDEADPSTSRRLSKFNFSMRSKKSRGDLTAERVVDHRKSVREQRREEEWRALLQERQELVNAISTWNGKIDRRKAKLESLREKDDAEKWEDELFETRMKELDSARTVIATQSSVRGEDIRNQIKSLNHEISKVAAIACAVSITRPEGILEHISKFAEENLLIFFQRSDDRLNDQRVVQAILQIFLAQSCVFLIESWYLGKPDLDNLLRRLYGRIRSKEEQAVAGKWRQLTISQTQNETSARILQDYANMKAQQLMQLSAAAGWGGEARDIEQRVQNLIQGAATISMNIKAGIISADLQPWIAVYRHRFNAQDMVDVGRDIGLAPVEDTRIYHVLGSTELGLRVYKTGDESSPEVSGLRSRPRVLLVESFWPDVRRSHRTG